MSNDPRPPKKLELTEPSPLKPTRGDDSASLPVSIELNQRRERYYQDFENSLRTARIELIKDIQKKRSSKIFVFYSHDLLDARRAEMFFELLQTTEHQQNLDLFLLSPGGFADQAFNMSRWCRQHTEQFNVIVPYYAKSAATLLCLGADMLLMGPSSELGPIDPQISIRDEYGHAMPVSALSIKDALKVIEDLTADNPEKALKYMPLIEKIDLRVLGQYDRAIQSSKQYASDLLQSSGLLKDGESKEDAVFDSDKKVTKRENIAHQLTEGYYSHGYAIDADTAQKLGFNIVCPGNDDFDTDVWKSVWRLHKMYDDMMRNNRNERLLTQNLVEYSQVTTVLETDAFIIQDLSQKYEKK